MRSSFGRFSFRSLFLWFLTPSLLGVGHGPSGPAGTDASGIRQCTDLKLSTDQGRPTHYVAFEGISDAFRSAGLVADFRIPGQPQLFPTDLVDLGGDRAEFLVIVHPTNALNGGPVELVFTSGDTQCPGIPFTIQALPPAPEVFDRLAATTEAIVVREIERWGGTTDRSPQPANVPPVVQALEPALNEIRGGNGRPSLKEAMAAADPSGEGRAVVGALLEEAGVTSAIDGLDAALSDVPRPEAPRGPDGQPDWSPEFLTPEILDALMLAQSAIEGQVTGRNKAIYDASAVGFGAASAVVAMSGVGVPIAGALGAASSAVALSVLAGEIVAGNTPAVLTQMVVDGDLRSFEEDHPKPEGRWSAELYAASKGFKLDITALGALPGAFKPVGQLAARPVSQAMRPVVEAFVEFQAGYLNSLVSTQRSIQGASAIAEIPPQVFGPVRIDAKRDEALVQWQISNRSFEIDASDPHVYRGREAGVSFLVVRTRPGRFGGESASSSLEVEVRPIIVTLLGPDERTDVTRAAPGQPVTIRATVANAINPCLRWRALNGGNLIPPGDCQTLAADFSATDAGFYGLEAESMTRTGIRSSATPKRYGGLTVRVGGLRLVPGAVRCVEVGEVIEFEVLKWDEPPVYSMNFEAQGGTITPTGAFTASTEGPGLVRVSDPEDPDLSDEVSFQIKSECVGWTMTLTGSIDGTWEGYCASYLDLDFLGTGMMAPFAPPEQRPRPAPFMYQLYDAEGNSVSVALASGDGNRLNEDGSPSSRVAFVSVIGLQRPSIAIAANDPEAGQPGLTVRHSGRPDPNGSAWLLSGTMSGMLYRATYEEGLVLPVNVEITFRGMEAGVGGDVMAVGSQTVPRLVCATPPDAGASPNR